MSKEQFIPHTLKVIDEWSKTIEGLEFVFQIKMTSGGGRPAWYPVTFWKKDNPKLSIGGRFDTRPDRFQVEEYFSEEIGNYTKTWSS